MLKRIHASEKPLTLPLNPVVQTHWLKPNGLWYGINDSWLRWNEANSWATYSYIYEITLAENINLLKLSTKQQTFDFHKKYTIRMEPLSYIDWNQVTQRYDGLEINPYFGHNIVDFSTDFMWYYGIDVPSGVIWNPESVVNIIPIKEEQT